MTKVYIVSEVGYEYNDETYDRQNGSIALVAYKDKVKAQEAALKRTREKAMSMEACELAGYNYDTSEDDVENAIREIFGSNTEFDFMKILKNQNFSISDKQLEQLLTRLDLDFFEVQTIEVEE